MTSDRFEIKRQIAATPSKVFGVVSSPSGHVRIDASGMLQSADGLPVENVGDEFVVHMDRESLNDRPLGKYEIRVVITKFERDRLIEWTVSMADMAPIMHLYGYELEPSEGGTLVTTYYDWSQISAEIRSRGVFPVISEATLRATLGILARTVEID
jgi:Polyketide cyclase / dehydrase and lipid transport